MFRVVESVLTLTHNLNSLHPETVRISNLSTKVNVVGLLDLLHSIMLSMERVKYGVGSLIICRWEGC
jgi:hypothetical protein